MTLSGIVLMADLAMQRLSRETDHSIPRVAAVTVLTMTDGLKRYAVLLTISWLLCHTH